MLKFVLVSLTSKSSTAAISRVPPLSSSSMQRRQASGTGYGGNKFIESKVEGPPEQYTDVEKSYTEWKFVEKLLPNKYIPNPPDDPTVVYASGWKAPFPPRPDAQYYVPRSKNHMVPAYLYIHKPDKGQQRVTKIRNVEGNIWALEKDIGQYLQDRHPNTVIMTWVKESWRQVFIHGEYDEEVRDWLVQQGF